MIKANDIVERYYTYYDKTKRELNFSPLYNVGLRNNCYLINSMYDTYSSWADRNSTTKIKRIGQ